MSARLQVGDVVVYRAHREAEPEGGVVTGTPAAERDAGLTIVRFTSGPYAGRTLACMTTRLELHMEKSPCG